MQLLVGLPSWEEQSLSVRHSLAKPKRRQGVSKELSTHAKDEFTGCDPPHS